MRTYACACKYGYVNQPRPPRARDREQTMGVPCRHTLLLLLLTRFVDSATSGNFHSGHLLPLGSHTAPINVKRLTYLPSPTEFYLHFVEKRTPVVMEGAITTTRVISNWQSDAYLRY